LLVSRSRFTIESDDFHESAVTSSLLYAKKNPPNKQSILLEIPSDSSVFELKNEPIIQEEEDPASIFVPEPKKEVRMIKPQSLQDFYPEIPSAKV
jgi:hypothetical protein